MTRIAESTVLGLSIRIFTDIHDPDLVYHWRRIQEETDCFPQMYYEWCEPWWRLQSGKRQLHVVAVEDETGRVVGIAPLCMENWLGLSILRSFPVHFGDYYSFVVESGDMRQPIATALATHLLRFEDWDALILAKIAGDDFLCPLLGDLGLISERLTGIPVSEFDHLSFSEFLHGVSKRLRSEFGRKLRRLGERHHLQLEWISEPAGYLSFARDMRRMYEARWSGNDIVSPDGLYYRCRAEAFTACLRKNKAALIVLRAGHNPIAFRLGFLHNNGFYSWKICHDPGYADYSPGMLLNGLLVEKLIQKGYSHLSHGAGDYPYKLRWCPDRAPVGSYSFFAASRGCRPQLWLKYSMTWRPRLRLLASRTRSMSWLRRGQHYLGRYFRS